MNTSRRGLGTSELARFFGKAWQVRFAGILVAATTLLVVAGTSVADSLQLSVRQRADSSLGSADARIQLPGSAPLGTDGHAMDRALVAAVTAAGGRHVEVDYSAAGLRPDGYRGSALMYEECAPGGSDSRRFALKSGTWPTRANEGLVSVTLAGRWPVGSTVSVFDGTLRIRIVGTVLNRFSDDADEIVAGPGSWSSMRSVSPTDASRLDEAAERNVRWSGASTSAALAAVTRVVSADPSQKAISAGSGGVAIETRPAIEELAPAPNVPLLVAGVGAPLAAGLLAGLFAGAFTRRTRDVMWEIGVAYRQTRAAALIALGRASVTGATAGVLLGGSFGYLLRPAVSRLATQELSPWRADAGWLAAIPIALAGALAGVTLVRAVPRASSAQTASARDASVSRAIIRTCAGLVMASAGVYLAAGTSDIAQMSLAALLIASALVLVLAPVVLHAVARVRPRSFAARLALRTVRSDRRAARITVIAIANLQILAFTLSILLTSSIAEVNSNVQSLVPPGQILFAPQVTSAHDRAVLRGQLENRLGLRAPVPTWDTVASSRRDDGGTLVISSVADLERLIDRRLDAAEAVVLNDGGTLVTRPLDGHQLEFPPDTGFAGATVPAKLIGHVDPSYLTIDGFILTSTAVHDRMGLVNPAFVYTNTTPRQRDGVAAAVSTLRINPSWVRVYRAPDQLTAPLRISAIVLVLALIAGIIMLFSSLAQARAMRPQLSGLQALGMGAAFIARVVTTRAAITFIVSTAFGIVASSIAVGIVLHLANLTFGVAIPAVPIIVMVAALALFTAGAAALATRRISRIEWQAL